VPTDPYLAPRLDAPPSADSAAAACRRACSPASPPSRCCCPGGGKPGSCPAAAAPAPPPGSWPTVAPRTSRSSGPDGHCTRQHLSRPRRLASSSARALPAGRVRQGSRAEAQVTGAPGVRLGLPELAAEWSADSCGPSVVRHGFTAMPLLQQHKRNPVHPQATHRGRHCPPPGSPWAPCSARPSS